MQVTPQLRQKIETKVQRLSRLVNDNARLEVTVIEEQTRSADDRYSVQLALSTVSHPVHSEVSAVNVNTALDLVLDKVVTQLKHQKDRQTKGRRHHAVPARTLLRSGEMVELELEEYEGRQEHAEHGEEEQEGMSAEGQTALGEEENEAIWSRVMEIRRLPTRSMTDQEVIAEMEQEKADFYPFFNQETNSVNVMYRLPQGGYGLLVPSLS